MGAKNALLINRLSTAVDDAGKRKVLTAVVRRKACPSSSEVHAGVVRKKT